MLSSHATWADRQGIFLAYTLEALRLGLFSSVVVVTDMPVQLPDFDEVNAKAAGKMKHLALDQLFAVRKGSGKIDGPFLL